MIYVVLPVFNEEATIDAQVRQVREILQQEPCGGGRIIIVDDGSTDGTAERLRALAGADVNVVTHAENQGLRTALYTGWHEALSQARPDDVIVTMDGDHTHPPELIPAMRAAIEQGAGVVIASRYVPGARTLGLSWHRRVFSWGANRLFQRLCPISNVRDYTCGYRAYRASALKATSPSWDTTAHTGQGFSITAEVLLQLRPLSLRMSEVPLVLRYDRKRGKSKMRLVPTMLETFRLLRRHAGGSRGRLQVGPDGR
jgi:dolichol-phosphate mannosyltransferase